MLSEVLDIWWIWIAAALALATLEVLVPGFVFLGFAIGAAAVGLMTLIGLTSMMSPAVLAPLFSALSLVAWLLLRRVFALPGSGPKTFDSDIND